MEKAGVTIYHHEHLDNPITIIDCPYCKQRVKWTIAQPPFYRCLYCGRFSRLKGGRLRGYIIDFAIWAQLKLRRR